MVVFTLITLGSLVFLALALPKWFRDVRALAQEPVRTPA